MKRFLYIYSLAFAIMLTIGEAVIYFTTDKYWPLSLDDGVAVIALLFSTYMYQRHADLAFYVASWGYITGNIYAVLFMRLDPLYGSGDRVLLVSVVLGVAILGLVVSMCNYHNDIKRR